ncbi:hypothetical protein ACMFMF_004648 [Clarireedia jacksonii]
MSSSGSRGYSSSSQQPPVIHNPDQHSSDSDSSHTRSSSEYNSESDMAGRSSNAHMRTQPIGETVRYRDFEDRMLCHNSLLFHVTNQFCLVGRKYVEAKLTPNSKGRLVNVIQHGDSKVHFDPDEPSSREAQTAHKNEKRSSQKSSKDSSSR